MHSSNAKAAAERYAPVVQPLNQWLLMIVVKKESRPFKTSFPFIYSGADAPALPVILFCPYNFYPLPALCQNPVSRSLCSTAGR